MAYSPLEIGPLQRASRAAPRGRAPRRQHRPDRARLGAAPARMCIAIPKASRLEHVRENRAALDIVLSAEDLADLDPPPRRPAARRRWR